MSGTEKTGGLVELRNVLRRRRWPALYAFLGVLAVSILADLLWPPSYRSTGIILIEQQELPTDLVRSAISSYADQRIQVITQRVMTTENLFRIIERYDLYPGLRRSAPREKILKRMREDIDFRMISADVIDPRAGHPTKATIAFSVGYQNRSPELAARVANELVSLYLQVNIESRKQDAANAQTFLSDEAGRLSKSIEGLQGQIATFKQGHLNDLPEMTSVNTQLMNHSDDDLREVDTQIRSLDQQVVYLDAQLAQMSPSSQVYTSTGERVLSPADRLKFLRTEYARVRGIYSPDHPDVLRLQREIAGLEKSTGDVSSGNDLNRQLQDAQTRLAAARQQYAPDHPDVIRLQRLVETLSADIRKDNARPATVSSRAEPDNPAYIELKAQRAGAIGERASLQNKRADLKDKIAEFEGRLAKTPGVEKDYAALVREMENQQIKYREVKQKQMEAQVSQNMEDERKGERFTLIEPPVTPEQPESPNRWVILILGLVLAAGAGFGTMYVLEAMDGTVRNRQDLEAIVGVPPLAVLPWIETLSDRASRARQRRYSMAGAAGAFFILIILLHLLYRPLDVLWQIGLRRLTG